MKGVKCTKYLKLSITLALLFVPLFILLNTSNASAASLGTSSFDLYYKASSSSSTSWTNNILYNDYITIQNTGSIYKYQFNTPSVQAGGNYATIHFETNLVASRFDFPLAVNPWVNLSQQNILVCNSNPSGVTIVSKNLSYATTPWFNYYDNNSYSTNNTLTFYGDIVLSGFTLNSNYSFICAVGSDSYSFYDGTEWTFPYIFYFEQNPMTIDWTNDQSIALNQMMVNQNTTIINQNQSIIDQDNQDRTDLENASNSAESDAQQLGQGVTQASSNLITIVGNFISVVLNPPQSDCIIDGDMGNMDLGNIDLCSLSPPPAFSIIGSFLVLGMLIPLVMACIFKFISFLRLVTGGK